MFKQIACPVDLEHKDKIEKALKVAGQMAKLYDVPVTYIGVTSSAPEAVAHSPKEYDQKLQQFAEQQGKEHGVKASHKTITSPDPEAELNKELESHVREIGADLVVMASHKPGKLSGIFRTHGGHIASEMECSVFVVRD